MTEQNKDVRRYLALKLLLDEFINGCLPVDGTRETDQTRLCALTDVVAGELARMIVRKAPTASLHLSDELAHDEVRSFANEILAKFTASAIRELAATNTDPGVRH